MLKSPFWACSKLNSWAKSFWQQRHALSIKKLWKCLLHLPSTHHQPSRLIIQPANRLSSCVWGKGVYFELRTLVWYYRDSTGTSGRAVQTVLPHQQRNQAENSQFFGNFNRFIQLSILQWGTNYICYPLLKRRKEFRKDSAFLKKEWTNICI